MKFDCAYINTNHFQESVSFYETVFNKKGSGNRQDRWVEFGGVSIYHANYDLNLLNEDNFSQNYIDHFKEEMKNSEEKKNNIITINLYTDNLREAYDRIRLKYEVSEIMYVHIHSHYYYFTVVDPDGNTVEIYSDHLDD